MDSPTEEKQTVQHVEVADADLKTDEWSQIKQDAAKAEEFEKGLGFWQSIKIYKAAVFWSMVASATIIMEGMSFIFVYYCFYSLKRTWGLLPSLSSPARHTS